MAGCGSPGGLVAWPPPGRLGNSGFRDFFPLRPPKSIAVIFLLQMLSRIISHNSSRTAACCRLPNTLLLRTATRPRGRPLPAIRVRRVTTTVADRVKNKLKLADDGYPLMEGSLMSRIHQEARKKMPQVSNSCFVEFGACDLN